MATTIKVSFFNTPTVAVLLLSVVVILGGIFAILRGNQAIITNEVDEIRIRVLNGNVSDLYIDELINMHNITSLEQNITIAELQLLLINSRIIVVQGNILILQNVIQIIDTNITTFFANITTLYNGIAAQWIIIGNLTETLQANIDLYTAVNETVYAITNYGLTTINYVMPITSNVDLVGTCGMNVSLGVLPGTVLVDTCALSASLVNLTNVLQQTAETLFASVNASNTTLNTLNGQSPIAGQIFIVAGSQASISAGIESNSIVIANTGLISINNITGVNSIVTDNNVKQLLNTTTHTMTLYLDPILDTINATLGIVSLPSPGPTVYNLSTNLTAYGPERNTLSQVCNYVANTNDITTNIWSYGFNDSRSFLNLLNCSISVNASQDGTVTKDCRYNIVSPATESHGACFSLFDLNALYVIEIQVTVNAIWWLYSNAHTNVNRLELQYCLFGTAGCNMTSSNWTSAKTTITTGLASAYSYTTFHTITVRSGSTPLDLFKARLFCRAATVDSGSDPSGPCYSSTSRSLSLMMTITRIV